jgi:hypothetical protein
MKNITVSVDDEIYRRARVVAAERDTSISAMVREYLNAVAAKETDFEKRKRIEAEARAGIKSFRASDRLSRDEIHRR